MADEQVVEASAEEVAEAKTLGWADKEQWKGNPEHWVDAKTFLDRGRHILPIVNQNNQRLSQELRQTTANLASLNETVRAQQATIAALESSHDEDLKEAAEAERKKIKDELTAASRDGRHEDVAELTVQLTELNRTEAALPAGKKDDKEEPKPLTADQIRYNQEAREWFAANPDVAADPRRMRLGIVIAEELARAGETLKGKAFLDKVADEVDKTLGTRRAAKVEGGNGGAGRQNPGNGSGKTYADLPAEAKAACDRSAKRLVGEGRAHKTIDSWRAKYTSQYFSQE